MHKTFSMVAVVNMQENSIYLLQFHDKKVYLGVYLINKLLYFTLLVIR